MGGLSHNTWCLYITAYFKEYDGYYVDASNYMLLSVYEYCRSYSSQGNGQSQLIPFPISVQFVVLNKPKNASESGPFFTYKLTPNIIDLLGIQVTTCGSFTYPNVFLPVLCPTSSYQTSGPLHSERIYMVSGVACIARKIIFISNNHLEKAGFICLLGMGEFCLKACGEVSPWVKIIENEISEALAIEHYPDNLKQLLVRIDNHLQTPPTLSSYKKSFIKQLKKGSADSLSAFCHKIMVGESGNPCRNYLEGPLPTLVDVALAACLLPLPFKKSQRDGLDLVTWAAEHCPRVLKWIENMKLLPNFLSALKCLTGVDDLLIQWKLTDELTGDHKQMDELDSKLQSISLQNRMKTKFKIDKERVSRIQGMLSSLTYEPPLYPVTAVPWEEISQLVHPAAGGLPEDRLNRKCEQLNNMVSAILGLVKDRCVHIVDFCAGGGHLGILLAHLLPNCTVSLVENKEESLASAVSRVSQLQLNNVNLYQCNLQRFIGQFDIGTSLHACGLATDLVLAKCIAAKASFVICPCCYGSIHDMSAITFPRSPQYLDIGVSSEDYLHLAHSGDQSDVVKGQSRTQVFKGKANMTVVDIDRKLFADGNGYKTQLYTMDPPSCSKKNNMLIGEEHD